MPVTSSHRAKQRYAKVINTAVPAALNPANCNTLCPSILGSLREADAELFKMPQVGARLLLSLVSSTDFSTLLMTPEHCVPP